MDNSTSLEDLRVSSNKYGALSMDSYPFIRGSLQLKYDSFLQACSSSSSSSSSSSLFDVDDENFLGFASNLKRICSNLSSILDVPRCAIILEEVEPEVKIIPLIGYSFEWTETWASERVFEEVYDGVVTSHEGPKMPDELLDRMQQRFLLFSSSSSSSSSGRETQKSEEKEKMMIEDEVEKTKEEEDEEDLFTKIVRNKVRHWRLWESSSHLAVLTPFPNSPGFGVCIPKVKLSSDVFSIEDADFRSLFLAVKSFVNFLKTALSVRRVAVICEGTGIDYAHVKVIPIWPPEVRRGDPGSSDKVFSEDVVLKEMRKNALKKRDSNFAFDTYSGFVSSLGGRWRSDAEKKQCFQKIKENWTVI